MRTLDFQSPLFRQHPDRETFLAMAASVMGTGAMTLRAVPFFSAPAPKELFAKRKSVTRVVQLVWDSDEVQLFNLRLAAKRTSKSHVRSGQFFVYSHPTYPKVYVLVTAEAGEFVQDGVVPLLRSLYPLINLTFISHKRLRRLLEQFQVDHNLAELQITRASQRIRRADNQKAMPLVIWPDMTLATAFDWVAQNNGWFNSIEFEAHRHGQRLAKVSLTRQGLVRMDSMFAQVRQSFIDPVAKTISENVQFFSQRSRRDSATLDVRPLSINFGLQQFADVNENGRLVQALRRLPKASVSVIHGNPYLHASIIDYLDGSTYDLWVLKEDEMTIVPQLKGTFPSIKRLINHIFDTYAEGEITEFRETQV